MVGADHMNSAGGYSAGVAEGLPDGTVWHNGVFEPDPARVSISGSGGSYFSEALYDEGWCQGGNIAGKIGGQGGNMLYCSTLNDDSDTWNTRWFVDSGGDGGKAGNGGEIIVSNLSKIFAFNGNKYTDGTDYNYGLNQTPIFAQNGILRAVYKLNSWWEEKENYNAKYFKRILGNDMEMSVNNITEATSSSEVTNYLIRKEITESGSRTIKSGYINPTTNDCYGIGSGAGYIEVSNGTFNVVE